MEKITCKMCHSFPVRSPKHSTTSTGDVTLTFSSGQVFQMSDIVLHYIADHGWLPAPNVVTAVMKYKYLGGEGSNALNPELVGYKTSGAIGHATGGFRQKLEAIFSEAILNGDWQPNL